MVFVAIGIILGIAYIIRFFDSRSEARSTARVEVTHQKMYDLIDKHFADSPELAREYKADADAYICGVWAERGREYSPTKIKQVTTSRERRERVKAENSGLGNAYRATKRNKAILLDAIENTRVNEFADALMEDPRYCPATPEVGKQRLVNDVMGALGMNRAEATAHVERIRKELRLV